MITAYFKPVRKDRQEPMSVAKKIKTDPSNIDRPLSFQDLILEEQTLPEDWFKAFQKHFQTAGFKQVG